MALEFIKARDVEEARIKLKSFLLFEMTDVSDYAFERYRKEIEKILENPPAVVQEYG